MITNFQKLDKEKARQRSFGHGGLVLVIGSLPELTRVGDSRLPVVRQQPKLHSPAADTVEKKLPLHLSQFIDLETHAGDRLVVVFPNALVSEVATMHYGRHASVSEDRRVSVAVSRYFTQDVLPIVRLVVFTDFVKNNDLLRHVSSPLFAWRNCQTCIGALTRLPPRMEGMKGREPYFLKVLIIRTDYEVPGHTGISGRLAMVVRLWTHVSLSQALGYMLAYLCIPVKGNRKSPYFRAFSRFLYWIKNFSSPQFKTWFAPMFFPGSFAAFCGAASPPAFLAGVVPRRRRGGFALIQVSCTRKEIASQSSPPRVARRLARIVFSAQNGIRDFV